MLVHAAYQHIEEMNAASFYYTLDNFLTVLENLKTEAKAKAEEMENTERYSTEFQEARFRQFILD